MSPKKPALPPIGDELDAPRRPDLRGLKPRGGDDAAIEANSQALGERWGASTSVRPTPPAAPVASLRLEIPDYLDNELALAAAQRRVTKAFLVLSALAQAGYRIDPKDLVPDRRKVRPRKMSS